MSAASEPPAGASARGAGGPRAVLGAALVFALVLLVVATFLLWQIADRVGDLETAAGGGTAAQAEQPPPLPPSSSGGSARALVRELDRTTNELSRPIGGMLEELRRAQLDTLPPALAGLERNTSELPATVVALNRLIDQTADLGGIGEGIVGLRGDLRRLSTSLPQLTDQLAGTGRSLGEVQRTIGSTNEALREIALALDSTRQSLDSTRQALEETRRSIERTNECLERPVLCGAPGSR